MVGDSQGTWAWNVYMCVCVCVCLSLLKVQTTPLNANNAAINNNNYNKCKILYYIQRGQPLNISRILPFPPRYFSLLPAFPTQNYNANKSTCKIRRGDTVLFLKAMVIFYAHPYLTELRLYSSVKCLYIWRHHGVFSCSDWEHVMHMHQHQVKVASVKSIKSKRKFCHFDLKFWEITLRKYIFNGYNQQ